MKKEKAAFLAGFAIALLLIATLVVSAKINTNNNRKEETNNVISSFSIDWGTVDIYETEEI